MSIKTSKGYLGIGLQTAKGVPNTTPDFYVNYLESNPPTEMDVTNLMEASDDELITTSIKNLHKEKFTAKFKARPQSIAYSLAFLLGSDVVTGAADPWTHTMKRIDDGRKWLTLRQKIDTNIIKQLNDAKISQLTIDAEAGKSLDISIEGNALTSLIDVTEDTPVYEVNKPFVFYHSQGAFKIDTVVNTDIKKFSITIRVVEQEGLQTDGLLLNDLPDLKFEVDISMDLYAADTAFWKLINYNNLTSPQEGLAKGEFEFDASYTVTNERQLKMTLKDILWNPVELPMNSEPAVLEQTLAGICVKPTSGDMIIAIVQNALATLI